MRKIPLLTAILALIKLNVAADVVLYPDPGDLSEIEGIRESGLFDVTVNGEDGFVYHGSEPEFNKYGYAKKGGHFFAFEHDDSSTVELSLKVEGEIEKFEVLPKLVEVEKESSSVLKYSIKGYAKMLTKVWIEGEEQWFILSAEEIEHEIPDSDDPSVLFLEAGVHQFGRTWDPFVDGVKTLYLAPGSVVQATIRSVDKKGISLIGKGVFAQAVWENGKQVSPLKAEWMADMMGMHFRDSEDIVVEGITVINCPSYQLEFADCEEVYVNNVKLLGFGESNNDGMHLYGRHILVENSFIGASDDRICVTGLFDREKFEVTQKSELQPRLEDTDVHDMHIRNMVFWGQKNGGDIMITWNGGKTCQDILVEDCYSLGFTNKGFLAAKHGGSVVAKDILIRNIELFHRRLVSLEVKEASCWGAGGGAIRDVLLENVSIHAEPGEVDLQMLGHSEESNISDITFINLTANGQHILSLDETAIKTNEFTKNIRFE